MFGVCFGHAMLYKHEEGAKSRLQSGQGRPIPNLEPGTISAEKDSILLLLPNKVENVCAVELPYCRWSEHPPCGSDTRYDNSSRQLG